MAVPSRAAPRLGQRQLPTARLGTGDGDPMSLPSQLSPRLRRGVKHPGWEQHCCLHPGPGSSLLGGWDEAGGASRDALALTGPALTPQARAAAPSPTDPRWQRALCSPLTGHTERVAACCPQDVTSSSSTPHTPCRAPAAAQAITPRHGQSPPAARGLVALGTKPWWLGCISLRDVLQAWGSHSPHGAIPRELTGCQA